MSLPEPAADAELVARIVAGDPGRFTELMRRHNQRLYRAARAITRDSDEAEDVVQQAWVTAFDKLDQFRGDARFTTWLTRIVINEALGRIRTRTRRADLAVVGEGASMSIDERTPEDEASAHELGRALEQQIDALPELYRPVLMLRDVEELDTAETAACLGITEEMVRVRLYRARQMLQASLSEAIGAATVDAFRFDGARCDRIVAAVGSRVGI